jgi:hypothetical protein
VLFAIPTVFVTLWSLKSFKAPFAKVAMLWSTGIKTPVQPLDRGG